MEQPQLGRYVIESEIGRGAMGVVFKATDSVLQRVVAVKTVNMALEREHADKYEARFYQEARAAGGLNHPNIVTVYDAGKAGDVVYMAMEYIQGVELRTLLTEGQPMGVSQALSIAAQVAEGLAYAHQAGVVHRDIKPANIILSERGGEPDIAKVVDFGLVQNLAVNDQDTVVSGNDILTGTPHYMSPEALLTPQASDPRGDLYALGAVAYYLLTGRHVFEGTSFAEIIGHHLHSEPAAPSVRLGRPVPPDLEAVVLQCLRKPAAERPQSARALRDALARCRQVPPWTTEDAVAWWQTFRANGPPRDRSVAAEDAVTIGVDMTGRLTDLATR
jgi:serine/threonine protein kinase